MCAREGGAEGWVRVTAISVHVIDILTGVIWVKLRDSDLDIGKSKENPNDVLVFQLVE